MNGAMSDGSDGTVRMPRQAQRPIWPRIVGSLAVIILAVILLAVGGLVARYKRHVAAEKADATAHAVQLADEVVRAVGRTPDKPVAGSTQSGERCNNGFGTIHGYHYEIFVDFSAVTAADADRMRSTLKDYLAGKGFEDVGAEGMAKYYGGTDKLEQVTVIYDTAGAVNEAEIDIEAGCVP